MCGPRSSHWPSNAARPPTPTGPTRSGPLPDAIWVESVSRAESYVTISIFRLLPACFCPKPAATFSSVGIWAGSSPVPRQQYQRRLAGANDTSAWLGAADVVPAGVAAVDPDGTAVGAVDGPHAEMTSARAATIEPARNDLVLIVLIVLLRLLSPTCSGWVSLTGSRGLLSSSRPSRPRHPARIGDRRPRISGRRRVLACGRRVVRRNSASGRPGRSSVRTRSVDRRLRIRFLRSAAQDDRLPARGAALRAS